MGWLTMFIKLELELELYFYLNTVNLSDKIIGVISLFEKWNNFCAFPFLRENCRFSQDVTKIQTTKLMILLIFYFNEV